MAKRKLVFVELEDVKYSIQKDINYQKRQAEKLAEANNPVSQRSNRRREILKMKSDVDSTVKKMYEETAKSMRTKIFNNIKLDLADMVRQDKVITTREIGEVIKEHATVLESFRDCCSKYTVRQGYCTQYESLFIDLINLDVRFLAFAPSEVFDTNNIKLRIRDLTDLGIDEFTEIVNSISPAVKKSEGFKKHYLKTFQSAKDQLFDSKSL